MLLQFQTNSSNAPRRLDLLLSAAGVHELAALTAIYMLQRGPALSEPLLPEIPELDRALRAGLELSAGLDRLAPTVAWTRCPGHSFFMRESCQSVFQGRRSVSPG